LGGFIWVDLFCEKINTRACFNCGQIMCGCQADILFDRAVRGFMRNFFEVESLLYLKLAAMGVTVLVGVQSKLHCQRFASNQDKSKFS